MNEFEAQTRAIIINQMLYAHAEYAMVSGCLRRFAPSSNIHIVLSMSNMNTLNEIIASKVFSDIKKLGKKTVLKVIISDEETTITTRLDNNQKLKVYICAPNDFYRTLAMTTGPTEYVAGFKQLWGKRGFRETRQGLRHFNNSNHCAPVWENEKQFFEWLGVKYLEPNERKPNNFELIKKG